MKRIPSLGVLILGILIPFIGRAQNQVVYTNSLANGWMNWSWATVNLANSTPVHGGTKSISVTSSNWQALYLAHPQQNASQFTCLTFWVNGGPVGGQVAQVQATRTGVAQNAVVLSPFPTNAWRQETIPLSNLGIGSATDFDGFWIQVQNPGLAPIFFVDEITLVTNANPLPSIVIASPPSGANYAAPAAINLSATGTANGRLLNKAQFYSGAALLGEAFSQPYSLVWSNVPPGNYNLFARLWYDATNTIDSSSVAVSVVTNSSVVITVNAAANRHAISPLIYGIAFASSNDLADLNAPLNRSGGNSETRYNWQLNAHNKAADWYFESLDDGSATPGASADQFVADSKNGKAEAMLTISMIGWMPKLNPGRARLSSFSIAKYGPQAGYDSQWFPDAGNGVISNSTLVITSNDPTDANFATNSTYQRAWLMHLTNRWGLSSNGGVRYYFADNEHTIWHSTHRDVHPVGTTMKEIRDKILDYAGTVKTVDPQAIVLGPEEWGWSGYFWSGFDQQWSGAHGDYNQAHFPDRGTNAGWDYLPWLLDQMHQQEIGTGRRLLDYFTVHYYPQSGEYGNDTSTSMQLTRNRSTRSLWDTNYVDSSWINSVVKLIPRMKSWVASYYPGTGIGITEYNWGGESHINGATAQADILGIFGREGLDLATRWTIPANTTPTYKAMKLFRNYDGNKSGFGETSISAIAPNPDNVSSFASVRSSDNALTAIVINKQLTSGAAVTLNLTNFLPTANAQIWQLTSGNTITRLTDIPLSGNSLQLTVPPQSVSLVVIPNCNQPRLRGAAFGSGNIFDFWLDGQAGQKYEIQGTTNFLNWLPVQNVTLTNNSSHLFISTSGGTEFYRAQWSP